MTTDLNAAHVARISLRIAHLWGVCEFINGAVFEHKTAQVFSSIVDLTIRECEIQPVALAKAFEVNTGTVSRWRSGKNAPHQHMRPLVIEWIKKEVSATADSLARELKELEKTLQPKVGVAAREKIKVLAGC